MRRGPKFDREELERVLELRQEGQTFPAIAALIGRSHASSAARLFRYAQRELQGVPYEPNPTRYRNRKT